MIDEEVIRQTSPEVASEAGKILSDPTSTESQKSVAGSALSQAKETEPVPVEQPVNDPVPDIYGVPTPSPDDPPIIQR